MEYIRCQQKVRPLRFAFAISPSDKENIIEAMEYSTALWGGYGNTLLPIWTRFPSRKAKSCCLGLIKDFDPDFIVNLTSIPLPKDINQDYEERVISKSNFIAKNKDNTFRFEKGLNILSFLTHVWETETKSISGKSRAIIFKDTKKSKYRKFWACLFGEYPDELGRDYSSAFKETLKAREIKATFKNLSKIMADEAFPPISLTVYKLTRFSFNGGFSSHIVYIGNPANALDLIEFWNIRASGREIFFLPINAYKLFGEQVKRIIKAGDYPINERVQNETDLQKAPSLKEDEFKSVCEWIKNDLGYPLSRRSWSPNWGRRSERVVEDIAPCKYYDDEVKSNLIFDEDRFSPLVLARPSFLSKSLLQKLNRPFEERDYWVNEIDLSDNYKNDYFFNFPSDKALTDMVARDFIFGSIDKVRLIKSAVVYYNNGIMDEVHIHPLKTDEVFVELFKGYGMNISSSPAGVFAKRIIEYMDRLEGCRVFKIRGIRNLLIQLSKQGGDRKDKSKTKDNEPKLHSQYGGTFGELKGIVGYRRKDEYGGPNWDEQIYKDLVLYYQQPKPLTPAIAIDYLFKKNVFRVGLRFTCQNCGKEDWYHLTEFDSNFTCRYCFKNQHIGSLEGTTKKEWHYKADGLFMIPNAGEGSLAVILALWRLHHLEHGRSFKYVTSQNIKGVKDAEVDFIATMLGHFQMGDVLILGEARNYVDFTRKDISKLIEIGSKFPTKPYLCFATLKDKFSDKEKEELKRVIKHKFGLIPLTRLDLDPYDLYNRFNSLKEKYAVTIKDFSFNLCSLNLGLTETETYDLIHFEEKKMLEKLRELERKKKAGR